MRGVVYIGVVAGGAFLVALLITTSGYNIQGLLLVALVLTLVAGFIIPRVSKGEGRFFLHFLVLALLLKLGASVFRYYWAFDVKGGGVDAVRYDRTGRLLADGFWNMEFGVFLPFLRPGTAFVEATTGFIYAFIGPTLFGGILLFTFLGFIGSCLYYKAFRLGIPKGNRVLFAGLIFLYPSWVYWPSIIGKDALMALWIGVTAYGASLFLRGVQLKGMVLLGIGLTGAVMVRPHVAVLLALAIGVAAVFRPYHLGAGGPFARIFVLSVTVIIGWVIVVQAAPVVGLDEFSFAGARQTYEEIQSDPEGGSSFEPVSIFEPLGIPKAIVTVLFRPFPWEAHRRAALILSLEGMFLVGLALWRFKSIKGAIFAVRSNPFLLFVIVYVALFIPIFTVADNFSILGRQRLQMLPLFFMLLAYPKPTEEKKSSTEAEIVSGSPARSPPKAGGVRQKSPKIGATPSKESPLSS